MAKKTKQAIVQEQSTNPIKDVIVDNVANVHNDVEAIDNSPKFEPKVLSHSKALSHFGLHPDLLNAILNMLGNKQQYSIDEARSIVTKYLTEKRNNQE